MGIFDAFKKKENDEPASFVNCPLCQGHFELV